ncbi:unnamed protein product [Withania somnifera]
MDYNTIPTSPTQWMDLEIPYYYQQTHPHELYSDSTIINTNTQNTTGDHHQYSINTISTENSSHISGNDHELISPKSSIIKPVRRRSRASKKTPTTLLNVSITNFQALVQQHTGCHSSLVFKNQKGPMNLSFGSSTNEKNEYLGSNSIGEGSMNFGYYNNHEDQADKYSKDNYLQQEEQESGTSVSAGYSNSGNSKLSVDDYGW